MHECFEHHAKFCTSPSHCPILRLPIHPILLGIAYIPQFVLPQNAFSTFAATSFAWLNRKYTYYTYVCDVCARVSVMPNTNKDQKPNVT